MSICSQFYLVYSIFFAISCVKTNKLPFCQIISIYALLAEGDLLEGYGNDNPGAKSQGMKQLMAGAGVAIVGMVLVPLLSGLFTV